MLSTVGGAKQNLYSAANGMWGSMTNGAAGGANGANPVFQYN